MNHSPFTLPLSIALLSVSSMFVSGQQPPGVPVARPPQQVPPPRPPEVPFPGQARPTPGQPETFSTNYRVTFSGKSDDKSLGELSTLTCARDIYISGPLNSSEMPTTFTVSGTLEESDGLLVFTYSIGFRAPVVTAVRSQSGQPQNVNVQYQDHSSKGTLKMKPGKTYELLKAGGNSYSIVVAPEIEK